MAEVVTNVLGALVLLVTAVSAYYANELRTALAGSELASVWKYVGFGVMLLFAGAIAGGAAEAELFEINSLNTVLGFMFVASIFLAYGLKIQHDKVK